MANKGEGRRLSGNLLTYDRQPGPYTEHRLATTPPGPSVPYTFYERYPAEEPPIPPPPPPPPFREGYPAEYGAAYWRPEREYVPPPPSPERYRAVPVEPWPRPPLWQEPEPPAWPERREPVRDPYTPQRPRPIPPPPPPSREVPATRMFEPSDTWKQTHSGPPPYPDSVGPVRERPLERFPELPVRDVRERPVDRPRPHEIYSPSQPTGERYRPYSPPPFPGPPSATRNRIPHANSRSDKYRPAALEPEWAPEDEDLYADRPGNSSREPLPPNHPIRSASQDRSDRRLRGRDNVERSVSPVSPRPGHQSSPSYGVSAAPMPKRESPELPHLVPLPSKPYSSPPVRTPLGSDQQSSLPRKPVSPALSFSSTASSSHMPHVSNQPPKSSLPPKPSLQVQSGSSVSAGYPSSQTRSPVLQITPVNEIHPSSGNDSLASTPHDERRSAARVATAPTSQQSSPAAPQQRPVASTLPERPASSIDARTNARRSYLQRAPAFVPSTLAIDAKLKYPDADAAASGSGTSKGAGSTNNVEQPAQQAAVVKADEQESDMEMSLPASPVRSHSPAALPALDVVSKVKGLLWREEAPSGTEQPRVASEEMGDAADSSDMDMSPPASPVLAPSVVPASISSPPRSPPTAPPNQLAGNEKAGQTRPTLSIDTVLASAQASQTVPERSPSTESAPYTPRVGDYESDMEMSPTPSVAPAPLPAPQATVKPPSSRRSPSPSSEASVEKTLENGAAARSSVATASADGGSASPTRRDAAVSPLVLHASLKPARPSMNNVEAQTTDTPTQGSVESAEQATPRVRRTTASMERPHVEAGELSPPVSEETLREETEGAEKDPDTVMRTEKEQPHPPANETQQLTEPTDQTSVDPDKVMSEIPLSDALRLVVRLRMTFPPQRPEERIDPIITSNRAIAEPEEPKAPEPESLVESVTEKEQQQVSEGGYDGTKHSLRKRFADHRAALAEKVNRLRKEYLALHEKWKIHCAKLDEIAHASALEEAAATAGRTTRRSAAMGDAVRTDLEMEQILASLGNEELTDANHLSAKNAAVIPDMVSVTKGRVDPMFDDTNNLVEDPHSFYALETGIDDWTEEEKAIFCEKYVQHPKQFGIIAEYLPNKTPAQCVTFYYLHKNTTIDFRKLIADYNTVGKRTRRGRSSKQKGNALLADILKHDDEVSRDSTPNTTSGRRRRGQASAAPATPVPPEAESGPSTAPAAEQPKKANGSRRGTTQNTPAGTPTPDPEPAAAASNKRPRRRVNPSAKAAAAMEQEDGEPAQDEDARPAKRTRRSRKSKAAEAEAPPALATPTPAPAEATAVSVPPPETKFVDQTELTSRKKSGSTAPNWSDDDKALFLQLLAQHGDDFKRIAASMPNKTTIQVTSFYKANLVEMELAKVAAKAPKRSPSPSGSGNGTTGSSNGVTSAGENGSIAESDPHTRINSATSQPPSTNTNDVPPGAAPSEPPMAALLPYPTPTDTGRPHVPAGTGPPSATVSPPLAGGSQGPSTHGTPSMLGAIAQRFSSLASAFPPFSYAALGTTTFAGASVQPPMFARLSAPQPGGANGTPMVLEIGDFASQPWMSGVPGRDGQVQGATPGLPATLETTEDLIRYLEHRTRLTAGQNSNNDSDFM